MEMRCEFSDYVWSKQKVEKRKQLDHSCHGPYTNSVFTCSAGQSLQLLCLSARLKGAVETKKAQSLVDVQRFEN